MEASATPQEASAHQPESSEVGESSSTQEEASAQSAVSPELFKALPVYPVI